MFLHMGYKIYGVCKTFSCVMKWVGKTRHMSFPIRVSRGVCSFLLKDNYMIEAWFNFLSRESFPCGACFVTIFLQREFALWNKATLSLYINIFPFKNIHSDSEKSGPEAAHGAQVAIYYIYLLWFRSVNINIFQVARSDAFSEIEPLGGGGAAALFHAIAKSWDLNMCCGKQEYVEWNVNSGARKSISRHIFSMGSINTKAIIARMCCGRIIHACMRVFVWWMREIKYWTGVAKKNVTVLRFAAQ